MVWEFTTLSQANTFIRVYNSNPNGQGFYARLIRDNAGDYAVGIGQ